jgi:septum formation protein
MRNAKHPRPAAPELILASTSRYRRELLERLRVPFSVLSPGVDETPLSGESPARLASRLAREKAQAVARLHPRARVIGSDQVACVDGAVLGKPSERDRAIEMLEKMQGREVVFYTAVAVALGEQVWEDMAEVHSRFGHVAAALLARYVDLDQPLDCAGAAKVETLGITLLDSVNSDDPTALIGLPLIRTCRLLRLSGYEPLDYAA